MKTVMITGCSSGFGREAASFFLQQGWKVIATMRVPRQGVLPRSEQLSILPLDVTDADSITRAAEAAGEVDVLVNNAGIGWMGPLEGTSPEMVRELFATNTFGTMEMIRALLPQFRARGSGVIINVSSSTTLKALPLLSVYTASKAAVNAFTESLALELADFGIRTHLVLPGQAPETQFSANARPRMAAAGSIPETYQAFADGVFAAHSAAASGEVTRIEDVTAAIWRAATQDDCPLWLPAGADSVALAG